LRFDQLVTPGAQSFRERYAGVADDQLDERVSAGKGLAPGVNLPRCRGPNSPGQRLKEVHMRKATLAILLGTLGVAACEGSNNVLITTPLPTFVLRTVNGSALPAVVFDSVGRRLKLEALSGTFALNTDNTFASVTQLRQTLAGVVTDRTSTCTGSFTTAGTTVTFVGAQFTADCASTFTGVLVDNTLTTRIRGAVALYSR